MRSLFSFATAGLILPALVSMLIMQQDGINIPVPHYPVPHDAMAKAAIACGEPPLQIILARQGYTIDELHGEVSAQRFVKAGPGPVITKPIAAYGLPDICSGGWYPAALSATLQSKYPQKHMLWQVAPYNNKQPYPPRMKGSRISFQPGSRPFGVWVSSEGFKNETVFSENVLQHFVARFGSDRHKAHVYVAVKNGRVVPNTYLIGWEYSTNDDNQDMVTMIQNVRPVAENQ